MTVRVLQEDNHGNRVVELSSEFDSDSWCSPQFEQLLAVLDDETAGLLRYSGSAEPQQFRLSFKELDTLIEAYQAYKQAQEVRLAEYERVQAAQRAEYEQRYSRPPYSLDDLPF